MRARWSGRGATRRKWRWYNSSIRSSPISIVR
ncbi:hypothetical protein BRN33_20620, partial [Xanthomonas oryzae pv. oryzae]